MRYFLTSFFLALILLPAAVWAADNLRHPELQKFEEQGGKVEFLGHAYGLDGWLLITKEGEPRYAYTTPEGGLVMGMLVDPAGKIETRNQLVAWQAKTKGSQASLPGAAQAVASKSEQFYAAVEKAAWVRAGAADAPYLYMFINVNCEHCQDFWKDLQGAVKAGKLQVRLAPYGMAPANRDGGAALLSVDDPAAAWQSYAGGDKDALSKDKIKDGRLAQVDANTALLKDWKVTTAAPFTVYRRLTDGTVTVVAGKPDNTMLVVADLMKPDDTAAAPAAGTSPAGIMLPNGDTIAPQASDTRGLP